MTIQNKRLFITLTTVTLFMLIPLVAMQFTQQVNWNAFDFLIASVLLYGTVLMIELALRNTKRKLYRVLIVTAILLACFLVWAELAVGIFGTPFAGS